MNSVITAGCRKGGCSNRIPSGLSTEHLCLDHFLDEAFTRTEESFAACQHGAAIKPEILEWVLSDALAVIKNLEESADLPNPDQRDRMLELLLVIANLHEYLAHHSVRLQRLA